MAVVHSTALVDPLAEIDTSAVIGPFCVVEARARIGANCTLLAHAQICSHTTLASGCLVGRGAILGDLPQDLHFQPGTVSFLEIGPDNVFREHVTIHRGSKEGSTTRLGSGNFFMVGSHVGHDCTIGDGNVVANACLLAGYVTMGNRAFLGGGSVFHQFIRIGDLAMTQGNARASQDVPPYTLVAGLNEIRGLNVVGLRRAGFTPETRHEIRRAFDLLERSGMNLSQALQEAAGQTWGEAAGGLISFYQNPSRQGICRLRRNLSKMEDS
jgi:UDP-N-acetylglucosamine acyltransferase